ncbi:MAG TPA: hypothetical protein IAA44_05405 [Candidatus Blautia avistercoris]|nr:hypothetical protein [Candidatus Blautia avistercoris]
MSEGSRKRVLDALTGKIPDKVPYMYSIIHHSIREKILGEKVTYPYPVPRAEFAPIGVLGEPSHMEPAEAIDARVAEKLGLDALGMRYFPPFFVDVGEGKSGVNILGGQLTEPDTLDKIIFPDPDDETIYKPAEEFCKRHQGEYALYAKIRLGVSFIMNCMGIEDFSFNIIDEPDFVKGVMEKYTKWISRVITNLQECGFDFLWSFDDMAYKTSLMFSPSVWDEFFAPYLKQSISHIKVPWIFHSDGNLMPILDKLLELGMNGIHPLEPGAMDLDVLKQKYGERVCLIGNIDINHTLTDASKEEVYEAVRERIQQMGTGGRFIISDSNSIPAYCNPQNILWMAEAVEKYRNIY